MYNSHVTDGYFAHGDKDYSVMKLVEAAAGSDIISIEVDKLIDNLNEYVWSYMRDDEFVYIKPIQVLTTGFPVDHYARIIDADLKYPILIYDYEGEFLILDGVHRLCKAKKDGIKFMRAILVNDKQMECAEAEVENSPMR